MNNIFDSIDNILYMYCKAETAQIYKNKDL